MANIRLVELFTSIANAIRSKDGSSGTIPATDFASRILAIPTSEGWQKQTIVIDNTDGHIAQATQLNTEFDQLATNANVKLLTMDAYHTNPIYCSYQAFIPEISVTKYTVKYIQSNNETLATPTFSATNTGLYQPMQNLSVTGTHPILTWKLSNNSQRYKAVYTLTLWIEPTNGRMRGVNYGE